MVNDDGSTDGTVEILEAWRVKGLIVSISQSRGLGATGAFLTLLQSCQKKEFVAFCDQDDVWEPRKLISQIQMMSGSYPQMVFSRRRYINAQSRDIGISPKIRRETSFGNALVENSAPGNTQLLNSEAIMLVTRLSKGHVSHYDSWIYLLISAFGECKYLDEPLVRYRIHSENSVGLRKLDVYKILHASDHYYNQALKFRNMIASAMLDENLSEVENFLKFVEEPKIFRRFVQCFHVDFHRQSKLDNLILKCLIIFRTPKQSPDLDS
jgi:glycosyltransferase involved in cell wall biosynthesis